MCSQFVRRTLSDRALYTHMLSAQGCALSAHAIFSSSSLGFFSQHAISARALSARALLARAISAHALSARALSARALSARVCSLSSCALSVRCQLLLFPSSSSCCFSSSSLVCVSWTSQIMLLSKLVLSQLVFSQVLLFSYYS